MQYLKGLLSAIASLFLAVLVPTLLAVLHEMSRSRTTGLGAVAGGFSTIFSPMYILLVVIFLLTFYGASRVQNKTLGIFLFWIPSILTSVIGFLILATAGHLFGGSRIPQ